MNLTCQRVAIQGDLLRSKLEEEGYEVFLSTDSFEEYSSLADMTTLTSPMQLATPDRNNFYDITIDL